MSITSNPSASAAINRSPLVSVAQPQRFDDKENDQATDDAASKGPGYVAHVALASARMMVDDREQAITPGMAVTVEIKTGRWSVISYLLSPLRRYAHEEIRER